MNTIRMYMDVENNTLNIVLPDNFRAKRDEVIIISEEVEISENTKIMLNTRIQHHLDHPSDIVEFDDLLLEMDAGL